LRGGRKPGKIFTPTWCKGGRPYDVFESFPAGFAKRGGALGSSVDTEMLRDEICGGSNQRLSASSIRDQGGTDISMEICGSVFVVMVGYVLIECILDTI